MATDVTISNISLGFLGDRGTVSSLNPPEGSAQAQHCAQFYPVARDVTQEERNWGFNTRRATPAQLEDPVAQWGYSYTLPNNTLSVIAVLPPGGAEYIDDLLYEGAAFSAITSAEGFLGAKFVVESAPDGTVVIRTNQPNATILYTVRVTDTSKFTPMYTLALTRFLAHLLAGPVIKGEAGARESINQLKLYQAIFAKAATKDANQSSTSYSRDYVASSLRARF